MHHPRAVEYLWAPSSIREIRLILGSLNFAVSSFTRTLGIYSVMAVLLA
jgi:hypothetical protein